MSRPIVPVAIDDPDDPRIAAYRNVRERDLVGRDGLFIAEGEVVLRRLVQSPRMQAVSVLLAAKRIAGLTDVLSELPETTPVYAAAQPVLDAIAGFPLHRGILGLGRCRDDAPTAADLLAALPDRALVLGLHGIANHDNVGALFRNAAAFGAEAVLLDASSCDPLYRKAIRVSVGAALTVPFARLGADEDMIALMQQHGVTPIALSPAGRTPLVHLNRPARAGLLLGAEGPGLPADMIARSQSIAIPMAAGFDSLNVAVTAGIVLHHLAFAADHPQEIREP
jgi:tRNA G18 (ribose-2'-O)-methylase SpoU